MKSAKINEIKKIVNYCKDFPARSAAIALILITLVIEVLLVNLSDFDGMHQGLIFAAAIAVSQGLFPNKDAFAQYGPLNPFLQGLFLRLTDNKVIFLQIFTGMLTIGISIALYLILRKNIDSKTSFLVSIAWLLTGPHGLPWASLPANLIILISMYLVIYRGDQVTKHQNLKVFIGGALLVLGVFARVQTILVYISVFVFLGITKSKMFKSFLYGGIASIAIITLILFILGSLIPYIEECIIWASSTLGYATVHPISLTYIFHLSWFIWTAVFLVGTIWLINRTILSERVQALKYRTVFVGSLLTLFFGILLLGSRISYDTLNLNFHPYLLNPKYLFLVTSGKLLFTLDFAPGFLLFGALVYMILTEYILKKRKFRYQTKLTLAFGIPCFSQLFPVTDSYHTWFVAPIFISCLVMVATEFSHAKYLASLRIFLVALLLILQIQIVWDISDSRYNFKNSTLFGMRSSFYSAPYLDETMNLLDKHVTPNSTRFLCPDGIYSTANGKYNSIDSRFVNWAPKYSQSENEMKFLFTCHVDESSINEYTDKGWKIVFRTPYNTKPDGILYKRFNVLYSK
jgi:hypothetical protein